MIHNDFEYLLEQAMGLDTASIGASGVERAVKERMSIGGQSDAYTYWDLVRSSAGELQALIEAVVVPETWFFRNAEAFAELVRFAQEEWLPRHGEGTLRLLSLPCSSGEEPYSMAMALCEAGFALDRCRIDAIDISARPLKLAQAGVYGKNSFRGTELSFRERFFAREALGYRLADAVRSPVHFRQGNLLGEDFLPGEQIYDIIFCRNLLIYFAQTTQDRAVGVLERLLKPEGVLFVGPPEGSLLLSHGFSSRKVPQAFAFRRGGGAVQRTLPVAAPTRQRRLTELPHRARSSLAPASAVSPAQAPSRAQAPAHAPAMRKPKEAASALDNALRLADQGHMAEAAEACGEHVRRNGPSVTAFFLMGVIRAATGSLKEAEQYYRKALYLDPSHHEALAHLHLLLEEQGDTRGAQAVGERLGRLKRTQAV